MTIGIAGEVTFSGSGLDRAAELRTQPDALASARAAPGARCIALWRGFPLLIDDGRALARLTPAHPILAATAEAPILLGRDAQGAIFAHEIADWQGEGIGDAGPGRTAQDLPAHPDAPEGAAFGDLRHVMAELDARDAELAATARALYAWHQSHRFCARCGAGSRMADAGWRRVCDSCGASHFPRTDPVVIMLVTHGNDMLIGRSPGWPEGMYSILAGFVEPGETIEAAVRREVAEEAGIATGDVRYLADQPWPFPSSLMFGCTARALTREIRLDPVELEDAQWVSRETMAEVFQGRHPTIKAPRKGAIAGFLLRNWLADRLV